jgi:hypothetical protein
MPSTALSLNSLPAGYPYGPAYDQVLDEVGVYSGVLSAAELAAHAASFDIDVPQRPAFVLPTVTGVYFNHSMDYGEEYLGATLQVTPVAMAESYHLYMQRYDANGNDAGRIVWQRDVAIYALYDGSADQVSVGSGPTNDAGDALIAEGFWNCLALAAVHPTTGAEGPLWVPPSFDHPDFCKQRVPPEAPVIVSSFVGADGVVFEVSFPEGASYNHPMIDGVQNLESPAYFGSFAAPNNVRHFVFYGLSQGPHTFSFDAQNDFGQTWSPAITVDTSVQAMSSATLELEGSWTPPIEEGYNGRGVLIFTARFTNGDLPAWLEIDSRDHPGYWSSANFISVTPNADGSYTYTYDYWAMVENDLVTVTVSGAGASATSQVVLLRSE